MESVDRPLRRLTREDVSLSGDPRTLGGLRLLVVDDDSHRALTLAEDLEDHVAAVALADGEGAGLETARELDPDAVVLDAAVFADPASRVLGRLRRDQRLRWAPLLVVPWEELEPFVEPLALLAGALAEIIAYDHALRRRAATEDRFEASIERTGPGRLLRLLADSGSPRRVLVEAPSLAVEVDLAEGLAVRAVARTPGEPPVEGLAALGRLLDLTLGRALVSRLPESPSANVALPLDEALARASGSASGQSLFPPVRAVGPGFDRVPGVGLGDPVEPSHSGVVPLGARALAPPGGAADADVAHPGAPAGGSGDAATPPDLTPVASLDLLAMRGRFIQEQASAEAPLPASGPAPWDDDESEPDLRSSLPTPVDTRAPVDHAPPEPAELTSFDDDGLDDGLEDDGWPPGVSAASTVGPPRAAEAPTAPLEDDPEFALLARGALPTPAPGPPDPAIEALGIQTDARTSTGVLVTSVVAVAALALLLVLPPFIRGLRDDAGTDGRSWPVLPTPSLLATAEPPPTEAAPPVGAAAAAVDAPPPTADEALPPATAPDGDVPDELPASRLLTQRGEQALAIGDVAGARALFEEALARDELANRAMAGLARVALAEGDPAGALPWVRRALAERPRRSSYYVLQGDVFAALGETGEARRAWRRAILHDPTDREALGRLRPETVDAEGGDGDVPRAAATDGDAAAPAEPAPAAGAPVPEAVDPEVAAAAAGALAAEAVAGSLRAGEPTVDAPRSAAPDDAAPRPQASDDGPDGAPGPAPAPASPAPGDDAAPAPAPDAAAGPAGPGRADAA